jgi:hypothetical protein
MYMEEIFNDFTEMKSLNARVELMKNLVELLSKLIQKFFENIQTNPEFGDADYLNRKIFNNTELSSNHSMNIETADRPIKYSSIVTNIDTKKSRVSTIKNNTGTKEDVGECLNPNQIDGKDQGN